MQLANLLPWLLLAFVVLMVFRVLVSAAKTSLTIVLWLIILGAAAVGWMWWKSQLPTAP